MKRLFKRIANWEAWPFKLIYAPLVPFWAWYSLRSGAIWFFTPSNPKITFGGMDGEPKKEMYDLLPAGSFPTTFNVLPSDDIKEVLEQITSHNLSFPLIVKPEMGGQGILFRKIDNPDELKHYHDLVPVEYIVQRMVHYPVEVSVFYIRHPKEAKGIITGFLHKIPLQVLGDGKSSLAELVSLHAKAAKRADELFTRHKENWNKILAVGEKYILSYAANHNRGAQFVDLKNHIDEKLVSVFDKISHGVNDFFYGRYDIMCESIESLKNGTGFTILEYNGCGAEPNHFYDTGYSLMQAYREILKHWKALYTISRYNVKQGIKPWPFMKGVKFRQETKELYAIMKKADARIR